MRELDTQTKLLLEQLNVDGAPAISELPIAAVREMLCEMDRTLGITQTEVHRVEDMSVPVQGDECPVRIYWPRVIGGDELLPVLIFYHGGGFVAGDIDTHDGIARYFCRHADMIVVNVGYRLAPEHKFPCAVEDCYAVLCWVTENANAWGGDSKRIAVSGDSGGGNLSTVVCLLSKERSGPCIAYQVMLYPVLECSKDASFPSRENFGGGEYLIGENEISFFMDSYMEDVAVQSQDFRASPLKYPDLSCLPPALIITAGFDPLCDEAKEYAERLGAAAVAVEYRCFESTIHGFIGLAGALDAGREALDFASKRINTVLNS